ncbi:MAG: Transrane Fragile-X-F protein [Clostridiaceae bacterium]|jgi:hypothetical protein|nr:Transrane Fragile-X-F protein [Clostridiaceae bacterium]MDF2950492.1 Transrane Fragile-X-F protein [Anaerocolumna sp.]
MGICEVLTIIFVICKLLGVISWSWFLVLLPEIIAVVLYVLIFVFQVSIFKKATKNFDKFDDKFFKF